MITNVADFVKGDEIGGGAFSVVFKVKYFDFLEFKKLELF